MKYIELPNPKIPKPLANWDDLREYFPYPKPRQYQAEVISIIDKFKDKGITDVIVNMPVGIGKSGIAATFIRKYTGAVYTPTLGLTEQYRNEFNWLTEVKGRDNFACALSCNLCPKVRCKIRNRGQHCTAANAYCVIDNKFDCPLKDKCEYILQRERALKSLYRLSSPQYIFNAIVSNERWHTEIGVFDEAHKLPDILMSIVEIKITHREIENIYKQKINKFNYDNDDKENWIGALKLIADKILSLLAFEENKEVIYTYNILLSKINKALTLLASNLSVLSYDGDKIIIKPVILGELARERIERVADFRIYLSGTIFNPNLFIEELGLDADTTLYINITKSPFPSQNRTIIPTKTACLGYNRIDGNIDKLIKDINRILEHHPNERGLIMPNSHKLRKAIQLGMPRRVITFQDNTPVNCPVCNSNMRTPINDFTARCDSCGARYIYKHRSSQLNRFLTELDSPLVLNNTYTMEGFDFGTDKATGKRIASFMIIVKIPYPPINDRFVVERMKYEQSKFTDTCDIEAGENGLCKRYDCQKCKGWYLTQTLNKIIQMSGRIIRSKDDVGTIYILDKGWGRFYSSIKHMLPEWFNESIKNKPDWL